MTELEHPKITMLVSHDSTTIELFDSKSAKTFVKVTLTNDQLASMLSRLGRTDCEIIVSDLDLINKKMESKYFTFEIDDEIRNSKPVLNQKCLRALADSGLSDWTPDNYYSSQNSFFTENGVSYARTTIRRWV